MKVIKAKEVRACIRKRTIKKLKNSNNPENRISIIRIGDDPADISYEKSIVRYSESIGLKPKVIKLNKSVDTYNLLSVIEEENQDDNSLGILVLRPLPDHIDEDIIGRSIAVNKDIDCMNPLNLAGIFKGDMDGIQPCTPRAVIESLDFYGIDLEGKDVIIVNRTMVVGKPLAMMFLDRNASVSICHSKTKKLKDKIRRADIVVTAIGSPKFFDESYFSKDSIVLDLGMSMDEDGNLSGDVDFDHVKDRVRMISPVPGGVGGITTSILLDQALKNL